MYFDKLLRFAGLHRHTQDINHQSYFGKKNPNEVQREHLIWRGQEEEIGGPVLSRRRAPD